MELIARYTQQKLGKLKMNREQLIGLIQSDAKFIDERADSAEQAALIYSPTAPTFPYLVRPDGQT